MSVQSNFEMIYNTRLIESFSNANARMVHSMHMYVRISTCTYIHTYIHTWSVVHLLVSNWTHIINRPSWRGERNHRWCRVHFEGHVQYQLTHEHKILTELDSIYVTTKLHVS